jgi:hypothetical protein
MAQKIINSRTQNVNTKINQYNINCEIIKLHYKNCQNNYIC